MTRVLLAAALLAAPAWADRDFLTANEVEQVRATQEPNERLALYIDFARVRLDELKQLAKDTRPGRSIMIHDLLDEYSQIVDAMDTVSEDALARKVDISKGTKIVASAEKDFLPVLEKLRDSQPPDLARYQFVLDQAIQATNDSIETAGQDLGKRSSEVADRLKKEKTEREAAMTPDEVAARKQEAAKETKEVTASKKPTLLKPGEKLADPPMPGSPSPSR
jgi:hypothetical protein